MNDDIFNQMSNLVPAKYKDLFLLSMVIGRVIHALRNDTGLKGLFSSIWLGTNTPKAAPVVTVTAPPAPPPKGGTA